MRTRKAVRARATAFEQNDLETRVNDQHHQALKLWLRLLACTNEIEGRDSQPAAQRFDTTLPRFDLMAQLERNPDRAEDERAVAAPDGDRRQRHRHHRSAGEGRFGRAAPTRATGAPILVQLTPAGQRVFTEMAAVHEQWVIDLFAD